MSDREDSDTRAPKRLLGWAMLAGIAILLFSEAALQQRQRMRERSLLFLASSPEQGRQVFSAKGCIQCHSVNGEGGKIGPDLSQGNAASSSLPKLITAMWNHAPTMWERMRVNGVAYPALTYEEAAQLLSYLYVSHHVDGSGDKAHGHSVFIRKGCVRCHSSGEGHGTVRSDWAAAADVNGAMGWSTSLWNHAPSMLQAADRKRIAWPQFQEHEIRDLYAFVRKRPSAALLGDPERGWRLFQQKSCAGCHSIRSEYQLQGPSLGPDQPLPGTFIELSGAMLNHFPGMKKAMEQRGIAPPALSAQEMADIFAFLYSLRYVEPTGSPQVGASVFGWRGCSRCHGENAEGTSQAPSLRRRAYNSVTLAVVLWSHGRQMYAKTRKLGYGWPTLTEEDVGDLLAFLNLPTRDR